MRNNLVSEVSPRPTVDAAVAGRDAPDVAMPTRETKRPLVKGPTTKLEVGHTATIGGAVVRFTGNNHKHAANTGRATGIWGFELAREGAKRDLELRSEDDGFEAEIDAHGVLLVFRHVSYDTFEVVLAANPTPKPLDPDACFALVAAAAKLPPDSGHSTRSEHGFVIVDAQDWTAYCGMFTRRVWFGGNRA